MNWKETTTSKEPNPSDSKMASDNKTIPLESIHMPMNSNAPVEAKAPLPCEVHKARVTKRIPTGLILDAYSTKTGKK